MEISLPAEKSLDGAPRPVIKSAPGSQVVRPLWQSMVVTSSNWLTKVTRASA